MEWLEGDFDLLALDEDELEDDDDLLDDLRAN
jgi:hypothetical protein